MPRLSQIVGRGKSGRSATNHSNMISGRFRETYNQFFIIVTFIIAKETLCKVDADRFINTLAATLCLARVGTNPPDNQGHGTTFFHEFQRFQILTIGEQSKITLNIYAGRASQVTRRHTIPVVFRQDQFQPVAACLANTVGIGMDNHLLLSPDNTRCGKAILAFNINNTNTAASQWLQVLLKA